MSTVFFVAQEWRGRLKVASMRTFPDEEGVRRYLEGIEKTTTSPGRYAIQGGNVTSGFVRVYELSPEVSPKNRTKYFQAMVLNGRGGG